MADNNSSINSNNFTDVKMEKIDNLDIGFNAVMGYLWLNIGMSWFTDYNVNIAATIIATIVAVIFGYWKIKEKKLSVKIKQRQLSYLDDEENTNREISQMAIEAARRELKEQQESEKKAGKNNE